jgi:signal transduction histidine kinase/CheY-like chemotaxis protein
VKGMNSITFKFSVGVFIVVAAFAIVFGVVGYEYEKRAIQNRVYAQLNAVADLKKDLVVKYLGEKINDLKTLSVSGYQRKNVALLLDRPGDARLQKTALRELQNRLNTFKDIYGEYEGLEIYDLNGDLIASSDFEPAFRKARDQHGHRSSALASAEALRWGASLILQDDLERGYLVLAEGMRDGGGNIHAALVSHINLADSLFQLFDDYTGLGQTGETLLVRRKVNQIIDITPTRHRYPAVKGHGASGQEYRKLAELATTGNEGIDQGIDYRGKAVIGAYRYIPRLGWGVVTKIDVDEAFAEVTALRNRTILLALITLFIMLGIAYLMGRKLTSPIEMLINNTKMITAGHFSELAKSGRTDEIGELEENFNEMVVALGAARRQAGLKLADLERKVEERTENLARANADLSEALENIHREIEEKKFLQAQLLHAQKMEAVGTLAGGIAHDFNNILTAIIGYSSVMRMQLADGDPNREHLDQILAVSERAANLTKGLLAFSRRQITNPQPVRLNNIVERVRGLLAGLMGENIELRVELDDADPVISADAGQLEQVVMNLATNARDAMPNGGSFTVATEVAEIDAQFIALHGYGISGKYAVMTASDTGDGMDGKTLPRIFEPFFTTKETGKGTGLGLSMVYGIIKAQNGYINCDSEPGKGTTFKIYLPLIRAEALKPEASDSRQPRGGRETILVAEDSAEVRKLTTTILTDFGYKVIEAVDGEEAVRKFKENRDAVNLLLLDVIMPRKNGKDACDEIRAMRPDLKVIFTSGYTADIIRDRGFLDKGLVLLTKPLTPRTLLEKIREVLDGKQSSS